jgi:hypothetical protein
MPHSKVNSPTVIGNMDSEVDETSDEDFKRMIIPMHNDMCINTWMNSKIIQINS